MEINHLSDIQQEILAPVQWAMNITYHTTLRATPGQLALSRDMILPTAYMAQWEMMRQQRQTITDRDNHRESQSRVQHTYSVGDFILIKQATTKGKLSKPTKGPYKVVDCSNQFINGTVVVDLQHSQESYNIRRLLPFCHLPY